MKKENLSKIIRWQHEETGQICEIPYGMNPGARWFKIPPEKDGVTDWRRAYQIEAKRRYRFLLRALERMGKV